MATDIREYYTRQVPSSDLVQLATAAIGSPYDGRKPGTSERCYGNANRPGCRAPTSCRALVILGMMRLQ